MVSLRKFACYWFGNLKDVVRQTTEKTHALLIVLTVVALIAAAFLGLDSEKYPAIQAFAGRAEHWGTFVLFVLFLFWIPFVRHEREKARNDKAASEARVALEREILDHQAKQETLLARIEDFEDEHAPLEIVPTEKVYDEEHHIMCGVLVKNPSHNSSATEVVVELSEISPTPRHPKAPSIGLRIPAVIRLRPKGPEKNEIHPQCQPRYNVFRLRSIKAGFGVGLVIQGNDLKDDEFEAEISEYWTEAVDGYPPLLKDYSFKIAVSARGRTRVAQTFRLNFDISTQELRFSLKGSPISQISQG
jgi:hypothetical protein